MNFLGVWTLGPNLPKILLGAAMIQHPAGGVIILGGSVNFVTLGTFNRDIYHLPSALAKSWFTLPQTLSIQRELDTLIAFNFLSSFSIDQG